MQGAPHEVENVPPDPDEERDTNPERQGPDPEPSDPSADDDEEPGQTAPPPEAIPGDQGSVPNPKQ